MTKLPFTWGVGKGPPHLWFDDFPWRPVGMMPGLVFDILGSIEDKGRRCGPPALAIWLKPKIREARLQRSIE